MQFKRLGRTDLELSRVGLGTWAMGGGDWSFAWGPQDDQRSIETIHAALDQGINWIDTAPVYGLGHSEEVVGRAIAGLQDRPIIATKCGRHWDSERRIYGDLTADSIIQEVDDSLRRLGIEVIDLYQIHWPDPSDSIEEGWSAIGTLIDSGKVRYGGVSNFSVQQMERVHRLHPIASLQPPYSMLRREVEDGTLAFCAEHEIGVVAYSPMQKGLLTGKVTTAWVDSLPDDDHRRRDPQFLLPELDANLDLVDDLKHIAEEMGHTMAQLAIAWALRRPEVTAAIVGGRRPEQIEETASAGDWTLDHGLVERIDALIEERDSTILG
jgi:aryl-alcohol dehydrogenase-like predicted oxidoreductase